MQQRKNELTEYYEDNKASGGEATRENESRSSTSFKTRVLMYIMKVEVERKCSQNVSNAFFCRSYCFFFSIFPETEILFRFWPWHSKTIINFIKKKKKSFTGINIRTIGSILTKKGNTPANNSYRNDKSSFAKNSYILHGNVAITKRIKDPFLPKKEIRSSRSLCSSFEYRLMPHICARAFIILGSRRKHPR